MKRCCSILGEKGLRSTHLKNCKAPSLDKGMCEETSDLPAKKLANKQYNTLFSL